MSKNYLKIGIAIALYLAIPAAIYQFTPAKHLFDQAFLTAHLPQLGMFAPMLFVLGCALSSLLSFPGNFLVIARGAVFGWVWSTLWATVGVTLGAVAAFWLTRSLLSTHAQKRFGNHALLRRLEAAIAHSPLNLVIAARVAPVAPLSLLNILFGLTAVRWGTYTLGTCLGILPSRAIYAWVGTLGKQALNSNDRWQLLLALTIITLLSIAPLLMRQPHRR